MTELSEQPLLLLAVVTLAGWICLGAWLAAGNRRLDFLREEPPAAPDRQPPLSVVVPARDEADDVEPALTSVLEQDYGPLEVVAVDDRSSDGTGEILDRMAERHERLRVVHVEELPDGWLGKSHALHVGAREAAGEVLLFTDADVVMARDVLRRAVGYLQRRDLDHITVVPDLELPRWTLEAATGTFKMLFGIYFRPWRARDPDSDRYVGTGAFNLLRADAYREAGGHEAIALRPADDLALGQLLKRRGYAQTAVLGADMLSVEWYSSVVEMVKGLDKNAFAVAGYRMSRVAVGTTGLVLFLTWPFVAAAGAEGAVRWVNAATAAVLAAIYADNARFYGHNPWHGPLLPATALLMAFIAWRSALKAVVTGRIEWRGTAYPLDELREGS
ncbi:MAG: glycosyltransferase [Gemmatimonadota bacterium]